MTATIAEFIHCLNGWDASFYILRGKVRKLKSLLAYEIDPGVHGENVNDFNSPMILKAREQGP